ncbi:MAG TPA: DsbA family protein [Gemmatimonadales bacterium]|jgi:predicted DsbA family dithiol-disulfide isomerase
MNDRPIPELSEWAEYYCPWCYIAAVRLHRVAKEYEGKVTFRTRPFPLELVHGEAAATLPSFEAAWCATQQGPATTARASVLAESALGCDEAIREWFERALASHGVGAVEATT